jgi:DNA-binding GntR family transcriptional regulator
MTAGHIFFGAGALFTPVVVGQIIALTGGITWAYWTLALPLLPLAAVLLRLPNPPRRVDLHTASGEASGRVRPLLVILTTLFLFLYVGIESGFGGWIFTYATTLGMGSETTIAYLASARTAGGDRVTLLLDEVLELRTFESFPGMRHAFHELLTSLVAAGNRFVLSTRYAHRAGRALAEQPDGFLVVHLTPIGVDEARQMLLSALGHAPHPGQTWLDESARLVAAFAEGRPAYARALAETLAADTRRHGEADPISSLCAQLSADGAIAARCQRPYEERLHRARGYGALKAILELLAEEEPLSLTEIAVRLGRTPGSTRDYLSWLEDVDLVGSARKRYRFLDPLLRVWVRLYCRPAPPGEDLVAREVRQYAMARLGQ